MRLIDTHTHLYDKAFDDGAPGKGQTDAVKRALEAGVAHMVLPNNDLGTIEPMKELAAKYPGQLSMAMGLHPEEIKDGWADAVDVAMDELAKGGYVAVGEVGIDMYWDKTFEDEQMQAFDLQITEAEKRDLPVIIHCREGLAQTLEVLQGHPQARAVFHSFSGTAADVDAIRRVGDYYFGLNGVATFKNCHVRDAVPAITLDRLVLETDSPYLAPVPRRGKRNESAYIVNVAEHLASHLGIPVDELARATTSAALALFPLIKLQDA